MHNQNKKSDTSTVPFFARTLGTRTLATDEVTHVASREDKAKGPVASRTPTRPTR